MRKEVKELENAIEQFRKAIKKQSELEEIKKTIMNNYSKGSGKNGK